ncbi:MAG: sensor histidine kinase [Spirosomataceae bacterium]
MNKYHYLSFAFLLSILVGMSVFSCKETNQPNTDSTRLIPPINHPTFAYLSQEKNINDPLYSITAKSYITSFLKQNKVDSATITLYTVAKNLFRNHINDSTLTYYCIQFTNKYPSHIPPNYWGFLHRFIATYFNSSNQVDSSIFYLNRGLIENNNNNQVLFNNAKNHYDLIFNYLHTGNLAEGLSSGQKSLDLFQSIDSSSYLGPVYSGIACVHLFENNYSKALEQEQLGYELSIKSGDSSNIYVCSLNKINLYNSINHPNLIPFIDSTLTFASSWIPRSNEPNRKYEIDAWKAYREAYLGNLRKAKIILDEIKPTVIKINNHILTDYYANALSLYELKTKKGAEDPDFYKNQIKDLVEYEDYGRLQLYYSILADNAVTNEDFQEALTYTRLAEIAKDSMSNLIVRDRIAQLDRTHQTKLKENTIDIQKAQLSKKQFQILALGILLIVSLLVAIVYIFWQKQKALQDEREATTTFTKHLFQRIEDERRRIANDLHDSVGHELLTLKNIPFEERQLLPTKVDSLIHEVRSISRNLHPVMFEKIGLIPNITQLIERLQTTHNFMISSEIEYNNQLSTPEELQIYRIIQESLTNCIKYAHAHAAKILLRQEFDTIHLQILDNGVGFDVDDALKNKSSFGLHSIIERSRALGGIATIRSTAKGTEVHVVIPTSIS